MLMKLPAGLPNITGQFRPTNGGVGQFSGAFSQLNISGAFITAGTTTSVNGVSFDASRSNAIYGNSNTVMPPTIQQIPQIKF